MISKPFKDVEPSDYYFWRMKPKKFLQNSKDLGSDMRTSLADFFTKKSTSRRRLHLGNAKLFKRTTNVLKMDIRQYTDKYI
jgi:hypothetical protein